MVGTHPNTKGGISTVVRGYLQAGLFDRLCCRYVATHRDTNKVDKALAALSGLARALFELVRLDAPLVHIHLSSGPSFWRKSVIVLLAKAARRPYILHVHSGRFIRFHDEQCGPTARRFISWTFNEAALVLALSEEWRTQLLRIAPNCRCEVLPNGVSLPDETTVTIERTVPPVILSLGRLGKNKGSYDLLEAFARLGDLQAQLVCAGDGEIESVRERARALGVASRVTCPGWLGPEDCGRLLARASIFVLPSYSEGLPMSLLEAMSYGLPAIATPVGGIPHVIRHNENGLLVQPGDVERLADALGTLLRHADVRERLGRAARETIRRNFTLAACTEQLARLYAQFGIPVSSSAH